MLPVAGGVGIVSGRETRPLRESRGCGEGERQSLRQPVRLTPPFTQGRLCGRSMSAPTRRRKMLRFRREPTGMRDVLPRGRRNASPTGRREVGRVCRGVVRIWKVLLHTSSVSCADTFPSRGRLGRCRARGRFWVRRKAERWRALNERPYEKTGNAAISPGTNGNARCFTAREAERLPYERTEGWAGLPMGSADMRNCAATIPQSFARTSQMPAPFTQGSL